MQPTKASIIHAVIQPQPEMPHHIFAGSLILGELLPELPMGIGEPLGTPSRHSVASKLRQGTSSCADSDGLEEAEGVTLTDLLKGGNHMPPVVLDRAVGGQL